MADCFDDIPYEDITICPNEEVQAGVSPVAYFLPRPFLKSGGEAPTPTKAGGLESAGMVTTDIEPIDDHGFIKLDLQVDLNSVTTNLVGNRGNKKDQTTLNIFVPGTRAKVLGFKRMYKNIPGIYLVKDYNGRTFQIGTDLAPAYIDDLEVTTGQGNEDNNGGTGTIICNANLYEYTGNIELMPNEED